MYTSQKSKVIKVISGTIGEALPINGNILSVLWYETHDKKFGNSKM